MKRIIAVLAVLTICTAACLLTVSFKSSADEVVDFNGSTVKTGNIKITPEVQELLDFSSHYVVVKAKQMAGSHYAYTDALAEVITGDDLYRETNFHAGSAMVLLALLDCGNGTADVFETELLSSTKGVIRDPDVSADGTKVLFSWKTSSADDYHIYELDMTNGSYPYKQLTFGSGHSDLEPKYLPNGNIVFSSNRDVQTVDCWHTTVCNNYIMNGDGSNIIRVGYDQVHTTYPTVCSDGRVLYTRWDYNDRTQMWVQGVFQMNQDGTNQTELFGNNSNFPTTLLHTREVDGEPGVYISVVSGHHVPQIGKLCLIDTNEGRNEKDAIQFINPDAHCGTNGSVDGYGQSGTVYKYPYAISSDLYLVSTIQGYSGISTAFDIVLMNKRGQSVTLVEGTSDLPASQIVPIKLTTNFNRPSLVNYAQNTGNYYVADVYDGEAMKGVERGSVAYLRVVEVVYRASAIGATQSSGSGVGDPFSPIATGNGSWDVKSVLGIVPVEADGSVLFSVPSDTPVYFQLLDKDGKVIQTMRSWSTLMPGETYSCVGCHEDKNTAPTNDNGITDAMKKGVQKLQPDLWMADVESYEGYDPYNDKSIGFSYLDVVQPIFDSSCIECHSNTTISYNAIQVQKANADESIIAGEYVISKSDIWNYSIDGSPVKARYAPFGKITAAQTDINSQWTSGTLVLTKDVMITQYDIEACDFKLEIAYSGTVTVKVNGNVLFTGSSDTVKNEKISLTKTQIALFKKGQNTVEVTVSGGTNYIDVALRVGVESDVVDIFGSRQTWKYTFTKPADGWNTLEFDDSSWKSAKAPFGDRVSGSTAWSGSSLFLRYEFTVTNIEQYKGGQFIMKTFYDEDPVFYINGKQIHKENGWSDSETTLMASVDPYSVLKEGKNVIAVSVVNDAGGKTFDTTLSVKLVKTAGESNAPFSLEGIPIFASRMHRTYPLSYLFLTGSTASYGGNTVGGYQFVGYSNKYVNFLSTMSAPEIQKPNSYGSSKSGIIAKLQSGHGGLTDNQIRAIACWIDLAVPAYGTYNEASQWDSTAERMFQEKENKRAFYDMLDKCAKMAIAGTLDKGTIEVTYKSTKNTYTNSGDGFVLLNVAEKYSNGSTVTVKLPEGKKYIAVTLNGRMGESIIYVPNGTWTYTFANITAVYPQTMRSSSYGYTNNMIVVRIPDADELSKERNLALNGYDMAAAKDAYPHATSSATGTTDAVAAARNVIDSFRSNQSDKANWPNQCWNPGTDTTNSWIKIDFGRNVKVNTLEILLRAAASDSHYTDAIVELSDGSTIEVALHRTADAIEVDLGGVTTSSLTIKGFVKAGSAVAPITEIAVYGTEA
ncbi:MAG: hypothetical protein E7616_03940 [Ruminococcaceae bacterium]|nr:hypothetical protein [Oscillospiraceae bacterium]